MKDTYKYNIEKNVQFVLKISWNGRKSNMNEESNLISQYMIK
jgi:hypothetical protein